MIGIEVIKIFKYEEGDKLDKNYCPECGRKLNKSDNFCPDCGINLEKEISKKEIVSNNEKKINKKEIVSNNEKKITKKHAIIIGLAIIIVLFLIIIFATSSTPAVHIDNVTVEKDGKLYRINYTYSGDGDKINVALSKNGKVLIGGEGGNSKYLPNTFHAKLEKDEDIDEIRFMMFDTSNGQEKYIGDEIIKDFNIIKVKNMKDPFTDTDKDPIDEVLDNIASDDDYQIAKSHRDLYDYDGDGLLNDYEFREFCKGEGQEELLNL